MLFDLELAALEALEGLGVMRLYLLLEKKEKEQSNQKVKDKEIWESEVEPDANVLCQIDNHSITIFPF